jgi:iron complex outermembrane receptor protein
MTPPLPSGGRTPAAVLFASAVLLGTASQAPAQSLDTTLPEITVTAPSPIARHRAPRHTAPATTPAPATFAPVEVAPQRGVLPIVTDQFATVTVVPNEELHRDGTATLGDLLFGKPGITGSSFAPGGASRPIIRGLDTNRVGIVENGLGAGGVSDLGEDHFVPIDPLATDRIEVIRGPAALRYGSTAIGGVVSASNSRIPERLPCGPTPWQTYGYKVALPPGGCVNVETRSAVASVDSGVETGVRLDAGGNNVALHADAYGRSTRDYAVPGNPYLNDPAHPGGRQANSATRSYGGAVGGSYLFDGGFLGAAITHNNSLYHIPGEHGAELNERIDARQTRLNVKGEYRPDSPLVDAVRIWLGATDYRHDERGLEDVDDPASDGVHQTFTDRSLNGRFEMQFAPYDLGSTRLTTALGVQGGHQDLTASSPENPGALYNGLFDPNSNSRVAAYLFNEFAFTPATRAQIAGRIEHVWLNGRMPDFPAGFLPDGAAQSALGRDLSFTPVSGSIGLLHDLPGDLVFSLTGQHVERAPKPAELFSRGGHHATGTFDIGNPNLRIETAQSVEIGLRRSKGPLRFEATAFYTRFSNFIYRRLTGAFCNDDFASCHIHDDHDDDGHGGHDHALNQAVYSQRDALFRGGEFQAQLDVAPVLDGTFGIEGQFDVVRATFTDGSNVPRIPPLRIGGGLFYRDANWLARINLLHAFAQADIAENETETAGYNLLRAEVSYRTRLAPSPFGPRELTVGVTGNNLLNEQIRNAVSYTKNEVLMPGLNVRLFANLKF